LLWDRQKLGLDRFENDLFIDVLSCSTFRPRATGYGTPPHRTGRCRTGLSGDCRNLCSIQFDCLRDLAAVLVIGGPFCFRANVRLQA
jgi:hypothetical protein